MRRRFLQDISINSFQIIINQLCGLIIFYILSVNLQKTEFGAFNWSLALFLTVFNILSCGIDQLIVKKIASGNNSSQLISIYLAHVVMTGLFFYLLLLLSHSAFHQPHLLLLLGIGKLMIFVSSPFKQLALGLEKFWSLMFMSICSNVVRSILLIIQAIFFDTYLYTIVIIFIIGDISELLICLIITRYKLFIPFHLGGIAKDYLALIREAIPQMGVVISTSFIARFDWIILGFLTSNVILAEYSFAYKVFEISTLPLLVVAPVLIPRFTRMFHSRVNLSSKDLLPPIFILLRFEMIIASLTGVILNVCWIPVINVISDGKYGTVNHITILLLSSSLPFLYFNNLLWTINFSKGYLKLIFKIIGITCIINLAGDIILIPFYLAEGAAAAFLIAMGLQSFMFLRMIFIKELKHNWYSLIICPFCAIVSVILSVALFINTWIVLLWAILLFFIFLMISGQLRRSDWAIIKAIIVQ